jgi:hypothetical protein
MCVCQNISRAMQQHRPANPMENKYFMMAAGSPMGLGHIGTRARNAKAP